ncbi:MAG: hypothetical protein AAF741_11695 [Bacteroidota bacterium]
MKKITLLIFASLIAYSLQAQFGVTAAYSIPQVKFDANNGNTDLVWDADLEFSVNYWFRLEKKRIEFLPSLSYARYQYSEGYSTIFNEGDWNLLNVGFQFHTRIYPFDFDTDCNCPTFGKQGPALDKGFFVQISPGLSYFRDRTTPLDDGGDQSPLTEDGFLPTLGLAIGLDFGLSNLVTLTPIAGARYAFGDLPESQPNALAATRNGDFWNLFAGLSLGVRLDEKRY